MNLIDVSQPLKYSLTRDKSKLLKGFLGRPINVVNY